MKFTTNRKLLTGTAIQVTSGLLYIVSVGALDHVSLPLKVTFAFCFAVAAILMIVGVVEDGQKRKLLKNSSVAVFPEAR